MHEVIKILVQNTKVGVLIIILTLIIPEKIMHAEQSSNKPLKFAYSMCNFLKDQVVE